MSDKPKPVLFMRLKNVFDQAKAGGIELYMDDDKVTEICPRLDKVTDIHTHDRAKRFPDQPTSVYSDGTFSVFDDIQDIHCFHMVKVQREAWLPEATVEPVKLTWHDVNAKPLGDDTGGLWLVVGRMIEMENESLLVCAQSEEQARQVFLDYIEHEADWSPDEKHRVLRNHDSISLVAYMYRVGTLEAL